jgi:hypothetical protein
MLKQFRVVNWYFLNLKKLGFVIGGLGFGVLDFKTGNLNLGIYFYDDD